MCAARSPTLYLASTSPRRRVLLGDAGIEFELHEPGLEPLAPGAPREVAKLRARAKAVGAPAPRDAASGSVVLGVDTVVCCGGVAFDKPADRAAAAQMLRALAGREHSVFSGHCLVLVRDDAVGEASTPRFVERCVEARVRCAEFRDAELEAYLDSDRWRGKAGGYGIQDEGASFMSLVAGEIDTVIGLSVRCVRDLLVEVRAET